MIYYNGGSSHYTISSVTYRKSHSYWDNIELMLKCHYTNGNVWHPIIMWNKVLSKHPSGIWCIHNTDNAGHVRVLYPTEESHVPLIADIINNVEDFLGMSLSEFSFDHFHNVFGNSIS